MFIAECPSLPGCVSQGSNRNEAIENIQDAIKGYLESLKKHDEFSHQFLGRLEFRPLN